MGRHAAAGLPPVRTAGRGRRRLAEPGAAVLLVFADGAETVVTDPAVLADAGRLLRALAESSYPAYPDAQIVA